MPEALLSWLVLLPGLRSHRLGEHCPPIHPCFLASSSLVERLEASSGSLRGPPAPSQPSHLPPWCMFLSSHCYSTVPCLVRPPSSSQLFKLGFICGRRSCAHKCPARHNVSTPALSFCEGEEREGALVYSPCLKFYNTSQVAFFFVAF